MSLCFPGIRATAVLRSGFLEWNVYFHWHVNFHSSNVLLEQLRDQLLGSDALLEVLVYM